MKRSILLSPALLILVALLTEKEITFSQLKKSTGLSYTKLVQEINKLKMLGFIEEKRIGRIRLYRIMMRQNSIYPYNEDIADCLFKIAEFDEKLVSNLK